MLRIGIDFDNTIVCYDRSFPAVAAMMGLIARDMASSKTDVKARLLSRPGGDLDWQRLQGQVYGRHMLEAEMFPGFLEFVCLTKLKGHEMFIVSHKSEFGHFDADRVPLRDQAMLWLEKNGLLDESSFGLGRKNVFFEATREDKLARIQELACTHFIDDLNEVLEEPDFPQAPQRILFQPGPGRAGGLTDAPVVVVPSWREMARQLIEPATEEDVCKVVQARFPSLGTKHAQLRKGRGNSRVYELTAGSGESYALKVYPDRQRDPRPRLETEFSACQELREREYPVAEAIGADKRLNWGIYRWIPGGHIEGADEPFLADAVEFVSRLYGDGQREGGFDQFAQASQACLSGSEIARQIEDRWQLLVVVGLDELNTFLKDEFYPEYGHAVAIAKRACGSLFPAELPRGQQIPSPSDFGSHNAIRSEDGRSMFIDFEYFGWDDPVKLVSDFYWHPGMRLGPVMRKRWIESCVDTFRRDSTFRLRLDSYLPLYGLRWCLILLNEFLSQGADHRLHADPERNNSLSNIRLEQLHKSRALLQEIKEVMHGFGPAIQAS